MSFTVHARLPEPQLRPHDHEEPAPGLGSVAKKTTTFVLSVFASIASFTILPVPIATGFSAIVILSSLAYALPNSTHSPSPVYIPVVPVRRPWYQTFIPSFSWVTRPVQYLRLRGSHAPVGNGAYSELPPPPMLTVFPPPPERHSYRPSMPGGSFFGGPSPLGRVATASSPPSPVRRPPRGIDEHAPVGKR